MSVRSQLASTGGTSVMGQVRLFKGRPDWGHRTMEENRDAGEAQRLHVAGAILLPPEPTKSGPERSVTSVCSIPHERFRLGRAFSSAAVRWMHRRTAELSPSQAPIPGEPSQGPQPKPQWDRCRSRCGEDCARRWGLCAASFQSLSHGPPPPPGPPPSAPVRPRSRHVHRGFPPPAELVQDGAAQFRPGDGRPQRTAHRGGPRHDRRPCAGPLPPPPGRAAVPPLPPPLGWAVFFL